MKRPVSICSECRFSNVDGPKDNMWSWKCTHSGMLHRDGISHVTGKTGYLTRGGSFTNERYPYACEVNIDGECDLFEKTIVDNVMSKIKSIWPNSLRSE